MANIGSHLSNQNGVVRDANSRAQPKKQSDQSQMARSVAPQAPMQAGAPSGAPPNMGQNPLTLGAPLWWPNGQAPSPSMPPPIAPQAPSAPSMPQVIPGGMAPQQPQGDHPLLPFLMRLLSQR